MKSTVKFNERVGKTVSFNSFFDCHTQRRSTLDAVRAMEELWASTKRVSDVRGYRHLSPFSILHFTDAYINQNVDELHVMHGITEKLEDKLNLSSCHMLSIYPSSQVIADVRDNTIRLESYRYQSSKVVLKDLLLLICVENNREPEEQKLLALFRHSWALILEGIDIPPVIVNEIVRLWKAHVQDVITPKLHAFLTHFSKDVRMHGPPSLTTTSHQEN